MAGQLPRVEGLELGGGRLVGQIGAVRTGQGYPSPELVISHCSATRSRREVCPAAPCFADTVMSQEARRAQPPRPPRQIQVGSVK